MFRRKKVLELISPINGTAIDLTQVNDQLFSQKMLGDGVAILPLDGGVFSPVNGRIIQTVDTKHAIGIVSDDGIEILIHLGLETVSLNGEGFNCLVEEGDKVKIGDKICEWDLEFIKSKQIDTTTPVIVTNVDDYSDFKVNLGEVNASKDAIISLNKK